MKLSKAIEQGFTMTHYDPNCPFYLSRDGKHASAFGCAALAVGMTATEFRCLLEEGTEDAFVYTLRSEIWYVMNQIWPWLSNDTCGKISGVEAANGFHDALACVLNHEPAEDDQLPPPKPKGQPHGRPTLYSQEERDWLHGQGVEMDELGILQQLKPTTKEQQNVR